MSIGYCWHEADRIGRLPLSQWAAEVKAITEVCTHADCGEPRNCRAKVAEYMRVQYACARARAKNMRSGAGRA